jgi:HSP20 family molecular chaperone IbpA
MNKTLAVREHSWKAPLLMSQHFSADDLLKSMQKMFEPVFEPDSATDVLENDDHVIVRMNVPGYDQEDISVIVDGEYITIEGRQKEQPPDEGYTIHRKDRRQAKFVRRIPIIADLDRDGGEAKLDKGVLTLVFPKSPQSKPRRIAIS